MADIAGWVALFATCVAAIMTAANLGSRITGWGFVIFTGGAIAWMLVGLSTGQRQLLYSNAFLAIVDGIGIWRWLGQRVRMDDARRDEERLSEEQPGEDLFSVTRMDGLPVRTADGVLVGHTVEALAACRNGLISHLVIRTGGVAGVGETLRRLPWQSALVTGGEVRTKLDQSAIAQLPEVAAEKRGNPPAR